MRYALDENDNHIFDKDGNKIEFSISYLNTNDWYEHREALYINDDNDFDSKNRNLVVKDAISQNHAVSKKQLDELNNNIYTKQYIDQKILELQKSITTAVNNLKSQITAELQKNQAKILAQMLNFRNDQVKNRIQRKYLKIPKTPHQWIKLFDNTDVDDDVFNLKDVIILNVWIKRFDRYHHSKSSLVESGFKNSLEFFYDAEMTAYYTYFSTVPSNWDLSCIIEWLRVPQPISLESNENIPSKPESNE